MRRLKRGLRLLVVLILLPVLYGCWSYREVDRLVIVAGLAIDKGETTGYKVTLDLIQIGPDIDVAPKTRIVSMEGESMFSAARNAISVAGKRLYWSHAKVIVISQDVAKDGVVKVLDWYTRDAETREDVHLLISREKTAGEIFTDSDESGDVVSTNMHEMLKNQKSLSKAPVVEIWRFLNKLTEPGCSPIAAAVSMKTEKNGKKSPEISGTAVFLNDKLLGFLDGDETFSLQMLQDRVEGGVIVHKEQEQKGETIVSLEVFKNKTEINPMIGPGRAVSMTVRTKTDVAIDEIGGETNYAEGGLREKLEKNAEETLKRDLEDVIHRVQTEYGADIFCFGHEIYKKDPKFWKSVSGEWPELFRELKVNVVCDLHIRNSAIKSKAIQIGD